MTCSQFTRIKNCTAESQDVSRTAPIGPELADAANALVIIVVLSFQDRNETLSPFSDSCLMTLEVPEKY
jgi:hypothetical protein